MIFRIRDSGFHDPSWIRRRRDRVHFHFNRPARGSVFGMQMQRVARNPRTAAGENSRIREQERPFRHFSTALSNRTTTRRSARFVADNSLRVRNGITPPLSPFIPILHRWEGGIHPGRALSYKFLGVISQPAAIPHCRLPLFKL